LVKEREKSPTDVYRRIFEEARSGLQKAGSTDSILGSLHAVGAMLDNQQLVSSSFFDAFGNEDEADLSVDAAILQGRL
jgi:FKBP12-rapamycin complex-associated protein